MSKHRLDRLPPGTAPRAQDATPSHPMLRRLRILRAVRAGTTTDLSLLRLGAEHAPGFSSSDAGACPGGDGAPASGGNPGRPVLSSGSQAGETPDRSVGALHGAENAPSPSAAGTLPGERPGRPASLEHTTPVVQLGQGSTATHLAQDGRWTGGDAIGRILDRTA